MDSGAGPASRALGRKRQTSGNNYVEYGEISVNGAGMFGGIAVGPLRGEAPAPNLPSVAHTLRSRERQAPAGPVPEFVE